MIYKPIEQRIRLGNWFYKGKPTMETRIKRSNILLRLISIFCRLNHFTAINSYPVIGSMVALNGSNIDIWLHLSSFKIKTKKGKEKENAYACYMYVQFLTISISTFLVRDLLTES